MSRLRRRTNNQGYLQHQHPRTGEWELTHRAAAINKFGDIPEGRHVHHRDGDKTNNQHRNLLIVTPSIHGRMHAGHPDACARCGRDGHWAQKCYAKTNFRGAPIKDS